MAKLKIFTFPDLVLAQKAKPIDRVEKPMQKPIPEKNPINYEMSGKLSPERAAEIFPELITNRPEPDPSFEERIKDATFRFEQERMQYRRPVRDNPQA